MTPFCRLAAASLKETSLTLSEKVEKAIVARLDFRLRNGQRAPEFLEADGRLRLSRTVAAQLLAQERTERFRLLNFAPLDFERQRLVGAGDAVTTDAAACPAASFCSTCSIRF